LLALLQQRHVGGAIEGPGLSTGRKPKALQRSVRKEHVAQAATAAAPGAQSGCSGRDLIREVSRSIPKLGTKPTDGSSSCCYCCDGGNDR
jgi:hypothetical protein